LGSGLLEQVSVWKGHAFSRAVERLKADRLAAGAIACARSCKTCCRPEPCARPKGFTSQSEKKFYEPVILKITLLRLNLSTNKKLSI
jgi:hypothetical protein